MSRRSLRFSLVFAPCVLIGCVQHSTDTTPDPRRSETAGASNGGSANDGGSGNLHLNLAGDGGASFDAGSADLGTCDGARAAKSTVACDYYALHPLGFSGMPQSGSDLSGSCYAAYLANTSPGPVDIHVEHRGQSLDVSKFARIPSGEGATLSYAPLPGGQLPPGEVAILFLSSVITTADPAVVPCPSGIDVAVPLDAKRPVDPSTASLNGAFHVTTSAPVVAYDFFPYGGGSTAIASASLLLPTTAWGSNYIGVDAYQGYQPWIAIVASEDDTRVDLVPTADIAPNGAQPGVLKGQTGSFTLARGETLRLVQGLGTLPSTELNGTVVQANHPIGMWGGSNGMCIPTDYEACDLAHQQVPPVSALGSEYVAVRYRNRYDGPEETPPWRILGVVPGTLLTYDPAPPAGAPSSLEQGQIARFRASGPFVVRSQDAAHPFYVSAHMTGCEYAAMQANASDSGDCRGDPEFVNVVPAAQYLSNYVFFTDPTYPETNLVVVRKKSANTFADVTLDCAGTLGGWQPVGNSGDYQYTRVDLVRHDFEKQGNCDNGRHSMDSTGQFGVTVWGWGSAETKGDPQNTMGPGIFYSQAVSYAYPAGAGVAQVNGVVVPVVK